MILDINKIPKAGESKVCFHFVASISSKEGHEKDRIDDV